ncbi:MULTISPECIES: YigZ family protein [unclassified Oceanispirochaeta]|uniref:YigZ family protein n=1 Tax=unclassified Oceanispirochaeta TaxID=2635722 RepID=UPI001314D47A|nr:MULTISPECIES: YigZ family protein [unclassified Oceanispirochaeta]MBF9015222.1 YigZ family protein [Oceanispirochaeta sp. M2]NPD71680.1 YigZ family protein [Oceanispirochaeta sp. M1]
MKKIMIPANKVQSEFSVKKSRFISMVFPVENDMEVRSKLKELRVEHPSSRHVVWSYVLGDAGTLYGLSDDGEPHGTAGRPALEVLKGSGLTYVALFVIRYFGGTKLGTGGLVSAYTQAAQDVLALVNSVEKIEYSKYSLSCSYAQYEGVKAILLENKALDCVEDFSEGVTISGKVPRRNIEDCRRDVKNFSQGSIEINIVEEE